MHWLIAEDETDIRNLVVMMTQVWGHTPISFDSGQKTWEWLDQVESGKYSGAIPDFVLMDIRMPGKRGNEISQRMRTLGPLKNVPIVLMTAFVMGEEEMDKMRKEFGVDNVINKPLPDFDRLKQIIDKIIEDKQKSVDLPKSPDAQKSSDSQTSTSTPSTGTQKSTNPQ